MNRQPIKDYKIIFNLSTLKGKNKTVRFQGTKQEAQAHAVKLVSKWHIAPQQVYLQEVAV